MKRVNKTILKSIVVQFKNKWYAIMADAAYHIAPIIIQSPNQIFVWLAIAVQFSFIEGQGQPSRAN
jgi:amino acid permease